MSNFDFLKGFDDTLWKWGNRIEDEINTPSAVKADATPFLEHLLKKLRQRYGLGDSTKDFYHRLEELRREGKISRKYKVDIYGAYMLRNQIHGELDYIEKTEYSVALQLHKKLFYIAKKYYRDSDEYDHYKGVPPYNPPQLDLTDDEIELLEVPDFLEIVEFKYDYCVVCGEPNHSNYSIYCENCYREIEDANNFISIRNNFGKDSTFRKEDLIEFGIHEAYAIRLINSLAKSNLLKVKGHDITINNFEIESYMTKIDNYISVGELITKFREGKITPAEIKQTKEYREGSFNHKPFIHFYHIINDEIINKFEYELISTENLHNSITYSNISQDELDRWYRINLNQYKKGNVNEAFVVFNDLLIDEYLFFKRDGFNEKDIQSMLNITKEMIEFFPKFRNDFEDEITEIKKELILRGLDEEKSREEVIEFAGITPKEYDKILKYFKDKKNKSEEFEKINNKRKEKLLINLTSNDLFTSCKLSKVTVDEFYEWYDESKIDSEFYIKSTKILMNNYLKERRTGKTMLEACESICIKENTVKYWLKRKDKLYDEFQDNNVKVIISLILDGFKRNKTKKEISKEVEISVNNINHYLNVGRKKADNVNLDLNQKSDICAELFLYYENEVIPRNLSGFLVEIKNKSLKKALSIADLTMDELNRYYQLNDEFHDEYLNFKKEKYIDESINNKKVNHEKLLARLNLSEDEYNQLKDEIDEIILKEKIKSVKKEIKKDKTTEVAAKHAGVKFDDIYDWYYLGKSDDEFKDFSEFFYNHYIEPNVLWVNRLLADGMSLERILKKFKENFTQKDFEIWQKEGLIKEENVIVDLTEDEENEDNVSLFEHYQYGEESSDNKLSLDRKNSNLYSRMNKDDDDEFTVKEVLLKRKNTPKNATILKKDDDKDFKKLKKEMGIKDDE